MKPVNILGLILLLSAFFTLPCPFADAKSLIFNFGSPDVFGFKCDPQSAQNTCDALSPSPEKYYTEPSSNGFPQVIKAADGVLVPDSALYNHVLERQRNWIIGGNPFRIGLPAGGVANQPVLTQPVDANFVQHGLLE